jgi:hypothetical protein
VCDEDISSPTCPFTGEFKSKVQTKVVTFDRFEVYIFFVGFSLQEERLFDFSQLKEFTCTRAHHS